MIIFQPDLVVFNTLLQSPIISRRDLLEAICCLIISANRDFAIPTTLIHSLSVDTKRRFMIRTVILIWSDIHRPKWHDWTKEKLKVFVLARKFRGHFSPRKKPQFHWRDKKKYSKGRRIENHDMSPNQFVVNKICLDNSRFSLGIGR